MIRQAGEGEAPHLNHPQDVGQGPGLGIRELQLEACYNHTNTRQLDSKWSSKWREGAVDVVCHSPSPSQHHDRSHLSLLLRFRLSHRGAAVLGLRFRILDVRLRSQRSDPQHTMRQRKGGGPHAFALMLHGKHLYPPAPTDPGPQAARADPRSAKCKVSQTSTGEGEEPHMDTMTTPQQRVHPPELAKQQLGPASW